MHSKKIVLISGSSSGMGKQTAIFLEKHGYIVYAGSRTPEKLDKLKTKNLIPIKLDITDPQNIKNVIKTIEENHKKIDILINNAGYGLVSTIEDLDEKEIKKAVDKLNNFMEEDNIKVEYEIKKI